MSSPFFITPNKDETFNSVASRLAAVNGVEKLTHFLLEMEISPSDFRNQTHKALERIADLTGVPSQTLERFAFRQLEGPRIAFGGEIWPEKHLAVGVRRVCPLCVLEAEGLPLDGSRRSLKAGFGRRAWVRAAWAIPEYRICAHHSVPLITLPPASRLDGLDHVGRLRSAYPMIAEAASAASTAPCSFWALERYIDARLLDCAGPHWCSTIPLHAVLRFSVLLGRALSFGGARRRGKQAEDKDAAAGSRGVEIVLAGPESIRAAFDELRGRFDTPNGGPQACYHPLYEELRRPIACDDAAYPFREIFREHLLENWAFDRGDRVLDTRLDARRLHSIRSAALEFELHAATVRRAFVGEGLIAAEDGSKADVDVLVPVAAAEAVLTPLADRLTREQVEALLGLSRTVTESLRDAGYLEMVRAGDEGRLHYTRFGVTAFRANLDARLHAGPPDDTVSPVPIGAAAKSLQLAHAAILTKILNGQVACWPERTPWGWRDLRLCREALFQSLEGAGALDGWVSRHEASRLLGVQPTIIDRLADEGMLQGELSTVPRTKLRMTHYRRSAIEELAARTIPIGELAKIAGCTPSEMRSMLIGHSVKPLIFFPRSSGELYPRAPAERILAAIHERKPEPLVNGE